MFLRRNAFPALLIAAGIILALLTRRAYLQRAYFQDDFGFLAEGPLHLADLPQIFSPIGIDWFYRPVFVIYVRAMSSLFGGAGFPRHLFSLVLFGINAGLVGWLAGRLSRRAGAAWLAMLLFVTAPGMEEALWWFASASTLIASVFSFLAVHFWINWRQDGRRAWAVAAGICLMAAMCAKEDAAALPFALAVLEGWLAHREPLRKRLVPLAWLLVWTCLWLSLDVTAYRHVSAHVPATRLWHTDIIHRLALTGSFAYRTLIASIIGGVLTVKIPLWGVVLVAGALLGWRVRRHPMLLAGLGCAVLAALPIPLASGGHVLSERFAFYPNAWAAVMGAVLIVTAIGSPALLTVLAGISVLLLALFLRVPLPRVDPLWQWCAMLFGCFGTAYWAIRLRHQERAAVLIASMAMAGSLAQALFVNDFYGLIVLSIALLSAALTRRLGLSLEGAVCGIALMASAPWALPLYLFAVSFPGFARTIQGRQSQELTD